MSSSTASSVSLVIAVMAVDSYSSHVSPAVWNISAQQIKKIYGTECKTEDLGDCDGCKTESGRLFSGCSKCQVRKCARERGVENCAHCDEYPCEELEKLSAKEPEVKKRLERNYNSCKT